MSANFVYITNVIFSQLEEIVTVDPYDLPIRFRMLLYCQERGFLQNYLLELLPDIDVCKAQI